MSVLMLLIIDMISEDIDVPLWAYLILMVTALVWQILNSLADSK